MIGKRKFLVDVDDGSHMFIVNIVVCVSEDFLDEVYELIKCYLEEQRISYTYFTPINITDLQEVKL